MNTIEIPKLKEYQDKGELAREAIEWWWDWIKF